MRLPLRMPSNLKSEQRSLYSDMRSGIESNFNGFTAISDTDALIGPFNPLATLSKVWRSCLGACESSVDVADSAQARQRSRVFGGWREVSCSL
jgi:hypothetical protein